MISIVDKKNKKLVAVLDNKNGHGELALAEGYEAVEGLYINKETVKKVGIIFEEGKAK